MENVREIEILLAEDNPLDAELTLRTLKKHHLDNKVHWVQDGIQALDFIFCTGDYVGRIPGNAPGLVLLDMHMPKVDGADVLKRLKGDARTRSIPVLVMISSDADREFIATPGPVADGYLLKPIRFGALIETAGVVGLSWSLQKRALSEPS